MASLAAETDPAVDNDVVQNDSGHTDDDSPGEEPAVIDDPPVLDDSEDTTPSVAEEDYLPSKEHPEGEKLIDIIIQDGVKAFHEAARLKLEKKTLEDALKLKEEEIARLRAVDEQKRQTIANLLKAQGETKQEFFDATNAAVKEASLRAELSHLREKLGTEASTTATHKRKATLLDEELRTTKLNLSRAVQEKLRVERDYRNSQLLIKTLEANSTVDVDYYMRMKDDLSARVESLRQTVADKNQQIQTLRAQMERSMSQNAKERAKLARRSL